MVAPLAGISVRLDNLYEEKQYRDKGERIFSMDTAAAKIVIQ